MRAIDKIIEMLSVCRKEIMDKGMKYPGATDMVLCLAKMEDEARRLAAEEKSGHEAPTPKEAPEGLVEGKCSRCDGTGIATFSDGLGHYEGNCPECCGRGSIMSRPAPSRTGELVKRLRDLIDRRYPGGVRGAWGNDIEEILRDYEGGA